jgi:glycerol-3-phosphate dehydrogenase
VRPTAARPTAASDATAPAGSTTTVMLTDMRSGERRAIGARIVVQATGVWGDAGSGMPVLRPLRGSHLVYARAQFPLTCAVAWLHPRDGRPVFAHGWEGAVLVGTTDLDHPDATVTPTLSAAEADYLVEALRAQFPGRAWRAADALASFAALRPIVLPAGAPGAAVALDPSALPRDSALWSRPGLVGITGGKLTTFRVTAREVLRAAARQHPPLAPVASGAALFDASADRARRLHGRLGADAAHWIAALPAAEQAPLAGSPYCPGELRRSLRHEHVARLDDLLLRRTRLGLVVPRGAVDLFAAIEPLCRAELGWDASRWADEAARYTRLWADRHAPPAQRT